MFIPEGCSSSGSPVNNVELKGLANAAGVEEVRPTSTLLGNQHYTTGKPHEHFDHTGRRVKHGFQTTQFDQGQGTIIRNNQVSSRMRCTTPDNRLARPVP